MIVLPLLILAILAFVFQTSTSAIKEQQYFLNCPYPINHGIATNINIIDTRLNYTVTSENEQYQSFTTSNYNGTYFVCEVTSHNPLLFASHTVIKNYGATLFSAIPYGWYAWVGDTITVGVGKVQPFLTMIYLMFTAPAQVTGLAWFTYLQIFLLFLIGFGIFLAVRG